MPWTKIRLDKLDPLNIWVAITFLTLLTLITYIEQGKDTAILVAIIIPAIWLPIKAYIEKERRFIVAYIVYAITISLLGYWLVNLIPIALMFIYWISIRLAGLLADLFIR